MNKRKECHFCQNTQAKSWIEEKHYPGNFGQILKEVKIGYDANDKEVAEEEREPTNIVYYCSLRCMEGQFDKEEAEDWAKGKCAKCGIDLVVINEQCQQLAHKKEMKYLKITTPDCLKK